MIAKNFTRRLRPVLALFCLTLAMMAVDLPTLFKQVKGSIVTLKVDTNTETSLGTGWMISPTQIVTCYHVVENAKRIEVVKSDGSKLVATRVQAADEASDVAVITIPAQRGVKPLVIAKSLPEIGEHIYVIGSPLGLETTVSEGIVSSIREGEHGGVKFIQFTAPVSHGSSGSPVINEKGEVVAVVSWIIEKGQALNFAVEVSQVTRALQRPAPMPSVNPRPSPSNNRTLESADRPGSPPKPKPKPQPAPQPQPQPAQPRQNSTHDHK